MNKSELNSPTIRLSVCAQIIGNAVQEILEGIVKEECPFILIVQTEHVAQYISNVERNEAKLLLEDLLTRWRGGMADVPAHENPEL